MRWLILLAVVFFLGCASKPEREKITGDEHYLMITTDRGPPFTTYTEYESEEEMKTAQMHIWRNGYGAKEVTKEEYEKNK